MQIAIETGEREKMRIEFTFNQLMGRTIIRANGQEVKRQVQWFSEPLVETHDMTFDEKERVNVRIEKRRQLLFASHYSVYVNNRLVDSRQGV